MSTCKECGQELELNATHCSRCGSGQLDTYRENNTQDGDKKIQISKEESNNKKSKKAKADKKAKKAETNVPKEKVKLTKEEIKIKKEEDRAKKAENKANEVEKAKENDVVTFKEYIKTYLTMLIPIYGIIKLILVLIGRPNIKKSITNSVRASLLVLVVVAIILKIVTLLMGMSLGSLLFLI